MLKVLMLLLLKQVVQVGAADWSITFENKDPCALNGSSVEFRCSYNYPGGESVSKTGWHKGELKDGIWKRVKLSDLPSFQNRFEYRGDLQHNCSLVLHDVHEDDGGYYYFSFHTNKFGRESREAVYLSVTGLKTSVEPSRVIIGDNVTLQCTMCHIPNIVWFRDGQAVEKLEFQAQAEDAGIYSCAVKGHESEPSQPVALDVLYPPLNVSVEVSHSGLVSVGSSVNLTCYSSARPAADTYTWFRRNVLSSSSLIQVGSEQVLSLSSVNTSHSGIYICGAKNPLGQNISADVLLTVEEVSGQSAVSPFIIFGSGLSVFILLLVSLAILWAWRRRFNSATEEENNSHVYENVLTIKKKEQVTSS
uniref:Ig-like domain-containing protein n=1 Tax=Iconisemion striatum TaxID=60296 RepID=A0A1A7XQN0_9TELE